MFNSNHSKKSAFAILLVLFAASPLLSAQKTPRPDVLDLLPAKTLFCVRINNLDKALGLLDEYIAGLSPMPIPLSMMARAPLGMILGDPSLKNVKTNGSFVIFGTVCCNSDSAARPKDLFVAGLIPVTDYDKFVKENPNCGEPDEKGISNISPQSPQAKKMLVKKVGAYAMVGPANGYDELLAAANTAAKPGSLGASLNRIEKRTARTAPFWANGNMQIAAKTFSPLIFAKVDEAKKALENLPQQQQPMASPAEIIDIYIEVLKYALDEIDHVSLTLAPSAKACTLSIDVSAVKGKDLAKMLVASKTRKKNTLLPYLQDDAMMNLAMKINKPLAKECYDRMFALIGIIAKDAISTDDMAKLKKLTNDELDSFGNSMAFSMSINPDSKPPFDMTYAADIQDAAKYRKILDDSMDLMNTGAIADIYKSMGLKLDFEIKQGVSKYKGVSIDSAKLKFNTTDPGSDMAKIIEAMYGEGFDYRWAIVNGLGVYAIGSDVDNRIKKLIDQAKAGKARPLSKEIKEALALLPAAQRADFIGTFNYIRAIAMGLGMMKNMGPMAPQMPKIDIPTESNIAFSGKVRNGAVHMDIALPKKHLVEIQAAFKQIGEKMSGQIQQTEKKKKAQPKEKQKSDKGVVAPGAKVTKIADGFAFTEGPVADAEGNVYFSDIPNNKVHKYSADGKVTVHRDNTGGANGLYFDKNGVLYTCAGGDRVVYFFCSAGRGTVAKEYDGKKLNSPNDLWIDPKGGIYFTDPRYGRNKDDMEQDGEHVYYILPGEGTKRKIIRVVDDMVRPNGIIGTPCGKKLYVADHGDSKTWSYKINEDGTLTDKKLFAEEGSDGLTIDNKGNIYLTNDAVKVYCCAGNKIATIEIPERPANVTFGGPDKQTLFITAKKSLYSIRTNVKGL